jgi:hypothetical protein
MAEPDSGGVKAYCLVGLEPGAFKKSKSLVNLEGSAWLSLSKVELEPNA